MRISPVLSLRDLPPAELQAAVLDGELVRIGGAFCAIDTMMGAEHRGASIATEAPARSIAERLAAAWVHGVIEEQPRRLQLCVKADSHFRPTSSPRFLFREVVIGDDEVVIVGGLAVTTPLRTALDIARVDAQYSALSAQTVLKLADLGHGFTFADCVVALGNRRNLPRKRLALDRLSDTFAVENAVSAGQPALTR